MLSIKKKYSDYLKNIKKEITEINLDTESIDFLQESIINTELLVPVIGAFSAGKSTLINSFLGREYLPVDITPETSLATELRYSDREFIEAIKADDSVVKYAINDWDKIKEKALEFKYLKLFLNNDNLKMIQPLILVDMPGFDSPLDLHNQAIINYINKGVHYIVLTSVEDGTITSSMLRQLSDIQEFGRDFSFFLSKTNLRSNSEVGKISAEIKEKMDESLDISKNIVSINEDAGESLEKVLNEIKPEKIIESVFNPELRIHFHTILDTINTSISTLKKDKEENENAISELKRGIEKVLYKRDSMVEEVKEKYSDVKVNGIIDSVGRELSDSIDELADSAISGGKERLSQKISEIVRHSLISKIRTTIADMSAGIVDDFAVELKDINSIMDSFSMNENWSEKIAESTKKIFDNVNTALANVLDKRKASGNTDKIYKSLTTILAVTTTILAPILEIIIIFLPDIISFLFKSMQEKKRKEEIKNQILSKIIPSIKRELRGKLPSVFQEQVVNLIKEISTKFEGVLQETQKTISTMEAEKKNKISNIEEEISKYNTVKHNISSSANSILFTMES